LLLMLYSATLLAPIPFGLVRIGCILFTAAASCALAYFTSSRLESSLESKHLSLSQVIVKPPFIVWGVVVVIIFLQLANGLLTVYWTTKK
jgi:hypothetical protein